jgi:MFS family permease
MDAITIAALVVAVVAAARSTWSPCGVSMLSTITPVTEASRERRYGLTVAWFLLGALAGGATLGVLGAALALGIEALDLTTTTALVLLAVLALVAAAFDARSLGLTLPGHGRQVNESWLTRYRSWVYGVGFGWQIGVGLATYIVTAAVYLTVAAAALTASAPVAFGIGMAFGVVRGLAIFLGVRLTTQERLIEFHRRFEAARETSRLATIGALLAVGAVAGWVAAGPVAAIGAVVVGAGVVLTMRPDQMRIRPTALGATTRVELGDRPTSLLGSAGR